MSGQSSLSGVCLLIGWRFSWKICFSKMFMFLPSYLPFVFCFFFFFMEKILTKRPCYYNRGTFTPSPALLEWIQKWNCERIILLNAKITNQTRVASMLKAWLFFCTLFFFFFIAARANCRFSPTPLEQSPSCRMKKSLASFFPTPLPNPGPFALPFQRGGILSIAASQRKTLQIFCWINKTDTYTGTHTHATTQTTALLVL